MNPSAGHVRARCRQELRARGMRCTAARLSVLDTLTASGTVFCGHGIGAALHDTLIAATPPGPRWLITHAHAAPALAPYRSRGWRTFRLLTLPDATVRLLMHRPR